jgi:hypothetical protein
MLKSKDFYRSLSVSGFVWTGFDAETGMHSFQRGSAGSHLELTCNEEDLTDGGLALFAEKHLTRVVDKTRAFCVLTGSGDGAKWMKTHPMQYSAAKKHAEKLGGIISQQ